MGTQKVHSVFPVDNRKVMAFDDAFQQYSLNSLRVLQPSSNSSKSIKLYQLLSNVCLRITWTSTFKIRQWLIVTYAVLQIKVFQLTSNYKVKFKAPKSCRRHVENQLRGLRWVGTWPCKILGYFWKKTKTKKKQWHETTCNYWSQHITFLKDLIC